MPICCVNYAKQQDLKRNSYNTRLFSSCHRVVICSMCLSELGSAYLINHITYCKLFLFLYMTGNYSFPGSLYYVTLTNILYSSSNSNDSVVVCVLQSLQLAIYAINYKLFLALWANDRGCIIAEGWFLNTKLTHINTQLVIIIFTINSTWVSSSPGCVCNSCAIYSCTVNQRLLTVHDRTISLTIFLTIKVVKGHCLKDNQNLQYPLYLLWLH